MRSPLEPDYYSLLGVTRTASLDEIKAAHRRLALVTHPDKVGVREEFTKIQEAYDILKDEQLRRAYDRRYNDSLGNYDNHITHFTRQGLRFELCEEPKTYDHYAYINKLFNLVGNEQLAAGQDKLDKDGLWEKLDYVGNSIGKELRELKQILWWNQPKWKHSEPKEKITEKINKIRLNSSKIGDIKEFLSSNKKKLLYDLSLDIEHTNEMKEIERQIGGREGLKAYIKEDPHINSADGIFALRTANCLTPDNFRHFIRCDKEELLSISIILEKLVPVNLLSKINFDLVIRQQNYATKISKGLRRLELVGILNQKFFESVVYAGKNAESVGISLEELKLFGILNEANRQIVVYKVPDSRMWKALFAIQQEQFITQAQSEALLWSGPEELRDLNHHIDQMLAHGLYLLTCDIAKGKTAMQLALELKSDLKAFFEKQPEEQNATKEQIKASFIQKLHGKDQEMSIHREYWKVIVANIFIAVTGVGLFAIGVNYLLNGGIFFAQTKREKLIEAVENTGWLAPMLSHHGTCVK
jgi:curved DNA-binding protein CbpA